VEKFAAEPDDPHYQVQSIPATHTDMPKVVSNEDEGYQRLLGAIKHTYNHANKVEDSRQHQEFLDLLWSTTKHFIVL